MAKGLVKLVSRKKQGRENEPRLMNGFVVFSVTFFLIILVAGSTAFIFSMRQIIRTNKGNELAQLLKIERMQLENSVNSEIAIVLKLADSPLIKRFFTDPGNIELEKIALEEIASYRRAFSGYSIFWINDIDKIFYSDDNEAYLVDTEAPENYWYNMTLYETEVYNFNINYNPDIQTVKLWVNAPVFDIYNQPIGMVGTGIELSVFIEKVYQDIDDRTELYLFNAAGEISGAKDVDLVVNKVNVEDKLKDVDLLSKAKSLKAGEVQTFDVPWGKVAIGTVPSLEWYSVAFMKDSIDDYNTAMTALFIVVFILISMIFIIFNVFISGFLRSLNDTMVTLKITSQAKSDFLARMSHEIRTPMNAITGMTELILREELSPGVRDHALSIKNAGNNLLSIINDILDLSKVESGKLEIIPSEYIFASLVNDIINIIRVRVTEKPIQFVVNLDSRIPNALIGDEGRVRQVLLNILSNALKYTNEGFIRFTVESELMESGSVILKFEVSDSGIGIKEEDVGKLFGDFVQVDTAAHKNIQGTGLGLAIARNLCRVMGGDIAVSSVYGEGSTFTIVIPQMFNEYERFASVVNPSEKKVLLYEQRDIYSSSIVRSIENLGVECTLVTSYEDFRSALSQFDFPFVFVSSCLLDGVQEIINELEISTKLVLLAEYNEVSSCKNIKTIAMPVHSVSIANILNNVTDNAGYSEVAEVNISFTAPTARVLIVDDVATNVKVAEGLMAPYKMQIDTCFSGESAIGMVQSVQYDIVFMDHMMPDMDGIETVQRIRSIEGEYFKTVPIIALTANAITGVREMFIKSGMNGFLAKPIETFKLNSVLDQWIPQEKKEKGTVLAVKTTEEALEIEGLDVNAGIMATGGKVKNYLDTLSIFYKDAKEKINQINACVESSDTRLYTIYVHSLKSTLASIGAPELSKFAEGLELAGINEDMPYINGNTHKFLQELETQLGHISNAVKSSRDDESTEEIDRKLLVSLKDALAEMNAAATDDIIGKLRAQNLGEEMNSKIEKVYLSILLFEYDEAVEVIDSILNG